MFANASNTAFFSNSSSLPPQAPPPSPITSCFLYSFSLTVFMSFSVTNAVVLLPFCSAVLFLGLGRRRRRGSATHSDVFTYNMVVMEMVGVASCFVYTCGFFLKAVRITFTSLELISFTSCGQLYFHILTCFDRYLAVVYPIIYLRLKKRGGARLRNTVIFCVWLLFFLNYAFNANDNTGRFFFLGFSIAIVSFFNFSVLFVLLRPAPGERVQVSRSKRRAFHTIMAVMSVLLLRIVLHLFVVGVFNSDLMSEKERCGFLVSGVFFSIPSSLVLPLLFLYRAKLTCCKKKTESAVTGTTS